MPQQIALYVEAFFAVGTEKRLLACMRSLMDDHWGVTRKFLLTYVTQFLVIMYPLWLRRCRIVHQGQLLLCVFRLYMPHPFLWRGVHVATQVTLQRWKLLTVVVHVVLKRRFLGLGYATLGRARILKETSKIHNIEAGRTFRFFLRFSVMSACVNSICLTQSDGLLNVWLHISHVSGVYSSSSISPSSSALCTIS